MLLLLLILAYFITWFKGSMASINLFTLANFPAFVNAIAIEAISMVVVH
jgi:hypothetical protein